MASRIKMTLEGGDELARQLERLGERIAGRLLTEAAMVAAEVVREEAKQRAPVRTGNLRDHIDVEIAKTQPHKAEVHVGPTKEAFYGMFIEAGTSKMPARPYLRPALDAASQQATEAARDTLRKGIKELTGL